MRFRGNDILDYWLPTSGVTVSSIEYEQLATARAWGYKIDHTEYWEDLSTQTRERLMALERMQQLITNVIQHDAQERRERNG